MSDNIPGKLVEQCRFIEKTVAVFTSNPDLLVLHGKHKLRFKVRGPVADLEEVLAQMDSRLGEKRCRLSAGKRIEVAQEIFHKLKQQGSEAISLTSGAIGTPADTIPGTESPDQSTR